MKNEEIKAIRGIDEIPVFSWNPKTKEFYVLGHKFDGINSIEDFIRYIADLQQENEKLKVNCNIGYEELKVARNYKSRCNKANEWIDKHQQTIENMRKEKFYILNLGVDDLKEFKNILNGENND